MTHLFHLFSFAIILLLISCGLPNPLEFSSQLVSPQQVEIEFIDGKFLFSITSYNTFEKTPNFSGYNIYYATTNNIGAIKLNFVLYEKPGKPTFSTSPGSKISKDNYLLDLLISSNYSLNKNTTNEIYIFNDYYFLVSSYDSYTKQELFLETPIFVRPPLRKSSIVGQNNISYQTENFIFYVSNQLIFNPSEIHVQEMGYKTAEDWLSIKEAPLDGYHNGPFFFRPNHSYVFKIKLGDNPSDYAMLYVIETNNIGFTYNLSYQKKHIRL